MISGTLCETLQADRSIMRGVHAGTWPQAPAGNTRHPDAPAVDFDPEEANSVCIIGNVGADPSIDVTKNGHKVTNMRIAVWQGHKKEPLWCARCTSDHSQLIYY
jgi:hypothetical protein